jgi:hypothetical protein
MVEMSVGNIGHFCHYCHCPTETSVGKIGHYCHCFGPTVTDIGHYSDRFKTDRSLIKPLIAQMDSDRSDRFSL